MTNLEGRVDRLEGIVTRLDERQEEHTKLLRAHQVLTGTLTETLEEVRRDAHQTQRLWVNLAKKHGWLDDDDLA